jgi:uncharacterized membrane protein
MNRKNAAIAMKTGIAFCLVGALLIGILVSTGKLNQQGVVAGIIHGLCAMFGFLIGRNIYRNDPTRTKKLMVFLGLWLLLGFLGWFSIMMPYLEMRPKPGFMPVLAGLFWAATVAVIYLGYQESRGSQR